MDVSKVIETLGRVWRREAMDIYTAWKQGSDLWLQFEKGLISKEEFFKIIFAKPDLAELDELNTAFGSIFELNSETVEIASQLAHNYELSIISNTNAIHYDRIKADYPDVMALFKKPVLSHEAHLLKPDAAIFRLALEKWHVQADQALFIDDKQENVLGARKVGIQAFRFTTAKALKNELINSGILSTDKLEE